MGTAQPRVNRGSVRLELQADCFAGLWAYHTEKAEQSEFREFLETGVVPESFTHGTAEQRMHWFKTGMDQGSIAACNTFSSSKIDPPF